VFDLDDADFLDSAQRERVINCARGSVAAIAGSNFVANFLRNYNNNVSVVWTGSNPLFRPAVAKISPPVLVWACSDPFGYPAEKKFVQRLLERLSQSIPGQFQFWLVGVRSKLQADEFFESLNKCGFFYQAFPFLPYKGLLKILHRASIGLAPLLPDESPFSAGKSFGKIHAYINCGLTVVASDAADHSLFFDSGRNGILAESLDSWHDAITFLVANPYERRRMAESAKADFLSHLSIQAAAQKVDKILSPLTELDIV
jgi:glycosyltransferase involved in cell wall biosynthesis